MQEHLRCAFVVMPKLQRLSRVATNMVRCILLHELCAEAGCFVCSLLHKGCRGCAAVEYLLAFNSKRVTRCDGKAYAVEFHYLKALHEAMLWCCTGGSD